jgi:predicted nucleic acid-binding protein
MIFDTDVLIWASRGNERAARAIDAAPDRALAIVSLMELLQGARSKLDRSHSYGVWSSLLHGKR